MPPWKTFEEHYNFILNTMRDTFEKKNHDYGDSTQKLYEQFKNSYFIRIADKFNRINTLLTNDNDNKVDEKLEDTILDLANYCVLWLANKNYVEERENYGTPKEGYTMSFKPVEDNTEDWGEEIEPCKECGEIHPSVSIMTFDSFEELLDFVDNLRDR